jgi:hypothetical protein
MSDDDRSDEARALPREAVERAVGAMRPSWRVADVTLAEEGHLAVYHLELEGSDAPSRAVLKATPPGDDFGGVHVEPRLLAFVGDRTSLPVPDLYGVVDDREGLPTPCFLMETVDDAGHVADHRDLGDDALDRLARTTGGYLAELHALDVADRFGTLAWNGDCALDGDVPAATTEHFAVADGDESWPAVVADWVDLECSNLAGSQFADGVDDWRRALDARIDALRDARDRGDVAFEPVLARIDHGLHNVVLASDRGDVAGIIDWAFALATTPGYDLAVVADVLAEGLRVHREDHPDRRDRVRDALLEGYRVTAGAVPDEYRVHRECYELLATVRGMNHLDVVLDDAPNSVRDQVASGLREHADELAGGPV